MISMPWISPKNPERGEIRAHLNRGCEVCMAGVKRALETTALIGATAPAGTTVPKSPPANFGFGGIPRQAASVGCPPLQWRRYCYWSPRISLSAIRHRTEATLRAQTRAQSAEIPRLTAGVRDRLRPPHHGSFLRRRATPPSARQSLRQPCSRRAAHCLQPAAHRGRQDL